MVERSGGSGRAGGVTAARAEGMLAMPALPPAGLVLFAHGSGSSRFSPRNNIVGARAAASRLAHASLRPAQPKRRKDRANVLRYRSPRRTADGGNGMGAIGGGTTRFADRLFRREHRRGRGIASLPPALAPASARSSRAADVRISPGRGACPGRCADAARSSAVPIPRSWLSIAPHSALCVVQAASRSFPGAPSVQEPVRSIGGRACPAMVPRPLHRTATGEALRCISTTVKDAGRRLAKELARFKDQHPVVLALPRGGVPVGTRSHPN